MGFLGDSSAGGLGFLAGFDAAIRAMGDLNENVQLVEVPGSKSTEETIQAMANVASGQWGAANPRFVMLAKDIVAGVPSKDYKGEFARIYDWVKSNVRYRKDPRAFEWVQTPIYTVAKRAGGCDCFVKGTLVSRKLGTTDELCPIEALKVGDEVWGLHGWSRVEAVWDRGIRKTWKISLLNSFRDHGRLTPEHKVWVRDANGRGDGLSILGYGRVRVSELVEGDVLLRPSMDRLRADGAGLLTVKSVDRDDVEQDCFDIATSDHCVWLAEHDWTTSQCDDHSNLIAGLGMALGHGAAFKTVCADRLRPDSPSHVYPLLSAGGKWVALDTTEKRAYPGWEPEPEIAWGEKFWLVAQP